MKKPKLRKNDLVVVVTGRDRGRQGKVLKVLPTAERVIVERVNMIKRHVRPNPSKNIAGGISEKEAPIHISNVKLICRLCQKPARVGFRVRSDGVKVRVCRLCGEDVD